MLEQSFQLIFHASNSKAKYEALIPGLRLAHGLKIRNIHAYCDSQLVLSQYSGEYEARDERMDAYLKQGMKAFSTHSRQKFSKQKTREKWNTESNEQSDSPNGQVGSNAPSNSPNGRVGSTTQSNSPIRRVGPTPLAVDQTLCLFTEPRWISPSFLIDRSDRT